MGKWTDVATWRGPTANEGPALTTHRGLVLHIAQGYYEGTIAWQKNPDADVSSHFVVGRNDGECAQVVDTDRQAWTQRAGNSSWMSSENAGFVPDALTAWQVEANAQIFAKGHLVYGWPLVVANNPSERGLGHHSMDREGTDAEWGHDDCPGSSIIKQKQAIVDRAIQIVGGGTDMLPDESAKLAEIHRVLIDGLWNHQSQTSTVQTNQPYPRAGEEYVGLSQPQPFLTWFKWMVEQKLNELLTRPPVDAEALWAVAREDVEWRQSLAVDIAALINQQPLSVSLTGGFSGSMSGSATPAPPPE